MTTHAADPAGVVYDLDGTLVRLDVDWDAVAAEVGRVYETAGHTPPRDLWRMLDEARDHGIAAEVEETIAAHERAGARTAVRLPLADELDGADGPVGVCSLNCEAACRIALETHGLASAVDVVVGRDTTTERKPHPEPLLAAVRGLELAPEQVVFVGDSARDARTADRAGTSFRWV